VLRHGAGSTRTDTLDHAAVLAEHGYGVLMMDARGHGLSGGRAMDFGWFGDLDVRAGVDFLAAQPDVDPDRIGVLGLSMGGEEAIGAAAADLRVRAVIAEGAGQRVPADKRWLPDEYGVAGTVQQQLDKVTYATADLLTDAEPPIPLREAVERAAPRPMLLIAGGAVPDEEHAARWIQAGSPDSVTVWVVPGAGHTAGLRTQPTQWEHRVTQFLGEALRA
jgi:pimeloyl-ACP methyl ester carboxylesterase